MIFAPIKLVVPVFFVAVLAGCAVTTETVIDTPKPVRTLEVSMAEANSLYQAGQADQAIGILKAASNSFPAEKMPWVRMAQIRFGQADYGQTIVNALEALQRDPKNSIANSLIAVSGLRLSTKALADLRNQNELSGDVRTEAQELAKVLRENVGEAVLVPPSTKAGPSARKAAKPVPKLRPRSKDSVVSKQPVPPAGASGDGDPFGALK